MIARHLETVLTQKLFQSKAIIIMGQGNLEKQPCQGNYSQKMTTPFG